MAKFQSPNYNFNCVVDPELWRLLHKRTQAKFKVDIELEYVIPLLATDPENADRFAVKVENSIKEIEAYMKDFKLAHKECVEEIIENTSWDEEKVNLTIGECNEGVKEVIERSQEVLAQYLNFKSKLQASKLENELSR